MSNFILKFLLMSTNLISRLTEIIDSFYLEKPESDEYNIRSVCPSLRIFVEYDNQNNVVLYSAGIVSGNGFKDNAALLCSDAKISIGNALAELSRMLDDYTPFCVPDVANKQNDLRTVSFVFSKARERWVFFPKAMTLEDIENIRESTKQHIRSNNG